MKDNIIKNKISKWCAFLAYCTKPRRYVYVPFMGRFSSVFTTNIFSRRGSPSFKKDCGLCVDVYLWKVERNDKSMKCNKIKKLTQISRLFQFSNANLFHSGRLSVFYLSDNEIRKVGQRLKIRMYFLDQNVIMCWLDLIRCLMQFYRTFHRH